MSTCRNERSELVYADVAYRTLDEFIMAQQRNLNLKMFCPGSAYAKLWEGHRNEEEAGDHASDDAYAYFDPNM